MANKFAIVYEESIQIPGDERSRTHPGHGYPESTHYYSVFVEFKDEDEMSKWVISNEKAYNKRKYRAFEIKPITVSINTQIQING